MANNQYANKFVFGGVTKFDLTGDDIKISDVKNGIKFHLPTGEPATGTNTFDADTSDATMVAAELLNGKTGYKLGEKVVGTMPNRGGVTGTIATKAGTYSIQQGYHDGSGSVGIDSAEQAKLIPGNIRQGIVLLGIEGEMSGSEDVHAQAKVATPSTSQQVIAPDSPSYNYLSQVTVAPIPYTETDNSAGGYTITIG